MIRAFKLQQAMNDGKQDKVLAVLKEYRRTCKTIASVQWRSFFEGHQFNKMISTKEIPSELSERYKRNCCYQVNSMLQSYLSNRQNDFKQIVYRSTLNDETKTHLFQINKRQLWFSKHHELFGDAELFLARKIFGHLLSKNTKPRYCKINMQLNINVAKIIVADKKQAPAFDYWVQMSTLEKRSPLLIPIKSNPYFNRAGGKLLNSLQINCTSAKEIEMVFTKDAPSEIIDFKCDKLAIDIGLKELFALHNGSLYGRNFYKRIKHYDNIITELAANRQRQELKTRSRRYDLLVKRFSDYLENEIGRLLNRIVKRFAPKVIVIEKLDFRNQNLSKRTNRLLSKFGKRFIEAKLKSLQETYGIEIQYVNPAYSSQECNKCHYVDKRNRTKQEIFKCKNCGHTANADVHSARNHFVRSSDKELCNIYLSPKTILRKLVIRFAEQNPRASSCAKSLLTNPYFKDYPQLKLVA